MSFRFNGIDDNDEIVRILMQSGLTRQQAGSVAAKEVVKLFAKDNNIGIEALNAQIDEMRKDIINYRMEIINLKSANNKAEELLSRIDAVNDLSDDLTDERAKNALLLYSALIQIGSKKGADIDKIIENAGYIVYAYLGGQAKREQTFIAE